MDKPRPNNALVNDVCAAALRAFFNASQRERYVAAKRLGPWSQQSTRNDTRV